MGRRPRSWISRAVLDKAAGLLADLYEAYGLVTLLVGFNEKLDGVADFRNFLSLVHNNDWSQFENRFGHGLGLHLKLLGVLHPLAIEPAHFGVSRIEKVLENRCLSGTARSDDDYGQGGS